MGWATSGPAVSVPRSPLRVGDAFEVICQQSFKREVEVRHFGIAVIFRETARYRRWTDNTSVSHETAVTTFEQPGWTARPAQPLSQTLRSQIPAEAMHSFTAKRNRLDWIVKVELSLAGRPDISEEFTLPVVAEKAP